MKIIEMAPILLDDAVKISPRIAVIGYPGAGKTTLCKRFKDHKIIHTDNFLNLTHQMRPELLQQHVDAMNAVGPICVEGNEVTRLITRGWKPNLLILVEGSERNDARTAGLRGRVDKFLREYKGIYYVINPRKSDVLIMRN